MILCNIEINWSQVLIVIGIFSAIAIILTVAILVATKIFRVDTDEKVERILSLLAGANCGGCGCSGCDGFAKKLCSGEAKVSDCPVTDSESGQKIAGLLGVEFEETEPTVMVVACSGGMSANDSFKYCGLADCQNEDSLFHGAKVCKDGCLGLGSCLSKCPEDAIEIVNGVAVVNCETCISCGSCAVACPKGLFERIPLKSQVYVACSSHCKGKDVMNMCKNGCIGCGICAKVCPEGAIKMVNNIPVIDHSVCIGCLKCVEKCPRKCIKNRFPAAE